MSDLKQSRPHLSDTSYEISFQRVELDGNLYFPPNFAAHQIPAIRNLEGRLYEPHTHLMIAQLMRHRPGSMIHAGAFYGDMLPSFAAKCTGTVYAFEPVLENFVMANLCVQANNLGNVFLMNAGLGEAARIGRIDTGKTRHTGGTARISEAGQITPIIALDNLDLTDIAVLHLDIEGHELLALRGAIDTIRRNRPIILVEDNNNDCADFLIDQGYAHAGDLPALHVWAPPGDLDKSRDSLSHVHAEWEQIAPQYTQNR